MLTGTARLTALEDMLTGAKTVHSAQIATTHAKLRTLIDTVPGRPILVSGDKSISFFISILLDSVFILHSLAPDKIIIGLVTTHLRVIIYLVFLPFFNSA